MSPSKFILLLLNSSPSIIPRIKACGMLLAIALLVAGCSTGQKLASKKCYYSHDIRLLAGINIDAFAVEGNSPSFDINDKNASSEEIKVGVAIGVHDVIPLGRNAIETGLDYAYSPQRLFYDNKMYEYNGYRYVRTSQLMVPITYNFGLFKKIAPEGFIELKIGYLAQLNFVSEGPTSGTIPGYSTNRFSNGLIFGLSAIPIKFKNQSRMGLFADAYYGTHLFKDIYSPQKSEWHYSAFCRFGIVYQF
jgi:hypothetical protein